MTLSSEGSAEGLSVQAVITNLMKCAFSNEIVLAPKLFLLQIVPILDFSLWVFCMNSGMSAVCLITGRFSYKHQCDTCRTLQCGTLFVSSIFGR